MAYGYDFDYSNPDGTQTPGAMGDSMRSNLTAMVHAAVFGVGFIPGWSAQAQDSDGTYPPTTPETPDQWVYSRGTDRIKIAITWNGVTDGQVDEVVASYSSNSGTSYDVIKWGTTNGECAFTYSGGICIAATWS